jgi:hypothetical protein
MGQIQSQNQYPIWEFVWKNANFGITNQYKKATCPKQGFFLDCDCIIMPTP